MTKFFTNKWNEPYIYLKFGSINSADFRGSEDALKLYEQKNNHTPEEEVEIVKLYKGNFYAWWDSKWITKEEAIDYILNYKNKKSDHL